MRTQEACKSKASRKKKEFYSLLMIAKQCVLFYKCTIFCFVFIMNFIVNDKWCACIGYTAH